MRAGQTEGLAQDVTRFAKTALGSGLLGRKGQVLDMGLQLIILYCHVQYAGAAMGLAQGNPSSKTGGMVGTAAASGLLGHKVEETNLQNHPKRHPVAPATNLATTCPLTFNLTDIFTDPSPD